MGFVFYTIASLIPLLCQGSFHDKSERVEGGLKKKTTKTPVKRSEDCRFCLGGGGGLGFVCSMEYFQILTICPSLNIDAKKLVFSHGTSSWFCLNLNLMGWYASVFLYLFI